MTNSIMRFSQVSALMLTICGFAGCGGGGPAYEGPQRAAVSGKVTYKGSPVQSGAISFVSPDDSARSVSIPIGNGEYSVIEAQGPTLGKYDVVITAFPTAPEGSGEEEMSAEQAAAIAEAEAVNEEGTESNGNTDSLYGQYVQPGNTLPAKYNLETELAAEITESVQQVNFDLTE